MHRAETIYNIPCWSTGPSIIRLLRRLEATLYRRTWQAVAEPVNGLLLRSAGTGPYRSDVTLVRCLGFERKELAAEIVALALNQHTHCVERAGASWIIERGHVTPHGLERHWAVVRWSTE